MNCPKCGSNNNRVFSSSKVTDNLSIQYRKCDDCGTRFKAVIKRIVIISVCQK